MVPMTTAVDSVLEEMTGRIVARFAPRKIILFGSRARGNHSEDSDYDFVVVLDNCRDRRRTAVEIRGELADIMAGKDILVVSSSEIEEPAKSPILREALRDGQVVYQHN